jgi:chromosomal replication initiation ATPase DnaA
MNTNDIIRQVATLYGVTAEDITGGKRHRIFADCRTVVCYVLCNELGLSTNHAGRIINRTHACVIYYVAKAWDWKRMPILNYRGAAVIREMESRVRSKSA